jgi:hypothetical protein
LHAFWWFSIFFERWCFNILVLLILCNGTFLIRWLLSTKILTLLYQNSTIYSLTLAYQPISSCYIDVWMRSRIIVKIMSKCPIRSLLNRWILILQLLLLFFRKSCFVCLRFDGITNIFICLMLILTSIRFANIIGWHWNLLANIIVACYY